MPRWIRALIAAYGAKKLGGGCFSTILVFVIIYYALGQCNRPQETRHGYIQTTHPAKTASIAPSHKMHVLQHTN